jgi:hypothetical protein
MMDMPAPSIQPHRKAPTKVENLCTEGLTNEEIAIIN